MRATLRMQWSPDDTGGKKKTLSVAWRGVYCGNPFLYRGCGEYLQEINLENAARVISEMDSDDAVDVLENLDADTKTRIVDLLDDDAEKDVKLILSYEDDEIGHSENDNEFYRHRKESEHPSGYA